MNDYDFLLNFVSRNGERKYRAVPGFGVEYIEEAFQSKWKTIHRRFEPIDESVIHKLEVDMSMAIPQEYRTFLNKVSNGLMLYGTTFCLDGKRTHYIRSRDDPQPFNITTPNVYERPYNATDNMFFIGGYYEDGSNLYIDATDDSVHFCKRYDATSLKRWDSLHAMLKDEVTRLEKLYGFNGEKYDEDIYSLPI